MYGMLCLCSHPLIRRKSRIFPSDDNVKGARETTAWTAVETNSRMAVGCALRAGPCYLSNSVPPRVVGRERHGGRLAVLPAREQGRAGKNQKSVMKCQKVVAIVVLHQRCPLSGGLPQLLVSQFFQCFRNSQLTKKRNRNIGADDFLTFFCGSVRGADST